jgi:hypothetical protein
LSSVFDIRHFFCLGMGLKELTIATANCFKDQRQFAPKDGMAPTRR